MRNTQHPQAPANWRLSAPFWALAISGVLAAGWLFREGLEKIYATWFGAPEYSHGILIPFITAYLIWQRAEDLSQHRFSGSLLALAVLGCLIGFLRFNTHPAEIFMGDTGSQFLGFSLGIFVILSVSQPNFSISQCTPLLLLGVPILDTLTVMFVRIRAGHSPFRPDKNHLHHKLLAYGLDHHEAVLYIYVVQALMVCAGVLLRAESSGVNALMFCATIAAGLLALRVIVPQRLAAHRPPAQRSGVSRLTRWIDGCHRSEMLRRCPLVLLGAGVPLYLLWSAQHIETLPPTAQAIGGGLWALSLIILLRLGNQAAFHALERLALWGGISAVVYHSVFGSRYAGTVAVGEYWFLGVLIAAIILVGRYAQPRLFAVTTMDFLVIFAVLGVPSLLGQGMLIADLGQVAVKSVILSYALALLILHAAGRAFWIRVGNVAVLSIFFGPSVLS